MCWKFHRHIHIQPSRKFISSFDGDEVSVCLRERKSFVETIRRNEKKAKKETFDFEWFSLRQAMGFSFEVFDCAVSLSANKSEGTARQKESNKNINA